MLQVDLDIDWHGYVMNNRLHGKLPQVTEKMACMQKNEYGWSVDKVDKYTHLGS